MKAVEIPPGEIFGRLTVLRMHDQSDKRGRKQVECQCECGRTLVVSSSNLRRGNSTSCGQHKQYRVRHGQARSVTKRITPEYRSFQHAKDRCNRTTDAAYADYGGRGIEFRFESFEEFFEHLGTKPSPSHTLDRINNNGHYEVGNVRWATKAEQANNRRPRKDRKELKANESK